MNLVKEESVESCVKKNAEDFFPTFEEFYSTWSALDSIEVKDGLLVNLLINEKVVSKLREKAGSEVFSQPFLKNLVYHRAKSVAGMFRYFFYSISAILFHSAEDATQWFLLNITAVAKLEF